MNLQPAKSGDRLFFMGAAIGFALLVFAGFARTFYLHALFRMPAPSSFLEFHGAVMTGWIVLLLVQVALIWIRRTSLHRQLGLAAIAYATVMIPIGCMATLGAAQREVRAHSPAQLSQLNVLGLELTQLLLFAGFFGAGIWFRRRADLHKRLMVLATLCILPNAIVRLTLLTQDEFLTTNFGIIGVWALFVLCVVVIDTLRNRRLYPAFGWGAFIAVAALYLSWMGSRTAVWDQFWTRTLS